MGFLEDYGEARFKMRNPNVEPTPNKMLVDSLLHLGTQVAKLIFKVK